MSEEQNRIHFLFKLLSDIIYCTLITSLRPAAFYKVSSTTSLETNINNQEAASPLITHTLNSTHSPGGSTLSVMMLMGSPSKTALFLRLVPPWTTRHSYVPVSLIVTSFRIKDTSPSFICLSCRSTRFLKDGCWLLVSICFCLYKNRYLSPRSALLHSTALMLLFGARHVRVTSCPDSAVMFFWSERGNNTEQRG